MDLQPRSVMTHLRQSAERHPITTSARPVSVFPPLKVWIASGDAMEDQSHTLGGNKKSTMRAVRDRAPGMIRAIEECLPRTTRQRCLAHRVLRSKVPEYLLV